MTPNPTKAKRKPPALLLVWYFLQRNRDWKLWCLGTSLIPESLPEENFYAFSEFLKVDRIKEFLMQISRSSERPFMTIHGATSNYISNHNSPIVSVSLPNPAPRTSTYTWPSSRPTCIASYLLRHVSIPSLSASIFSQHFPLPTCNHCPSLGKLHIMF